MDEKGIEYQHELVMEILTQNRIILESIFKTGPRMEENITNLEQLEKDVRKSLDETYDKK